MKHINIICIILNIINSFRENSIKTLKLEDFCILSLDLKKQHKKHRILIFIVNRVSNNPNLASIYNKKKIFEVHDFLCYFLSSGLICKILPILRFIMIFSHLLN